MMSISTNMWQTVNTFLRSGLDVTCSKAGLVSLVLFLVETGIEKVDGGPEKGIEVETKTEMSKAPSWNPYCSKRGPQASGGIISFTWELSRNAEAPSPPQT